MVKRIACVVINPVRSPYHNDQYDSFRTEGRIPINMGFGLSLLGFSVDIIMNEWRFDGNVKKVENFDNLFLRNGPAPGVYYDYLLTWETNSLYSINYDKAVFTDFNFKYIDDVLKVLKTTKKKIIYTCYLKYLTEFGKKQGYPIEVSYLPPLFPIPSDENSKMLSVGFIPFNGFNGIDSDKNNSDNSDKKELNIYIYSNIRKVREQYIEKQKFVITYLKEKFKDKEIKLIIHTDREIHCYSFELDNKRENIIYLYEQEARYIDIINSLKLADICIMVGTDNGSPCLVDAISLGKPTIYISSSLPTKEYINHIYDNPEYLLYTQETDEESIKKLEKFILDPKESYHKFKESHKDFDFDNWKEFAKLIFV